MKQTQPHTLTMRDKAWKFDQLRMPRPQTNLEICDMMADFADQELEQAHGTIRELTEALAGLVGVNNTLSGYLLDAEKYNAAMDKARKTLKAQEILNV